MDVGELIFDLVVAGTLICLVGWPLMLIVSLVWCVRESGPSSADAGVAPPAAGF